MKNKKYYVLYKTITDTNGDIIDIRYIKDFINYEEIRKDINITNRDIKKMVNNNVNQWDNLKTFKNYLIIKE